MTDHESTAQGEDSKEHSTDRVDELIAEFLQKLDEGTPLNRHEFLAAHPDSAEELREFFADVDRFDPSVEATLSVPFTGNETPTRVRYFGEYELLREIARGGMGVVYEARQKTLDRTVAVKMILAGRLAGDDDVRRFRTEAQAAARLQHPGIVSIHEVGVHQGQHYFSMDFVQGHSLAEQMANGPLEMDAAARIVRLVAEAMEHAHQQGVLHRDLKPSNILIGQDGQPRVTDFGLAKQIGGDSSLTGTGDRLGTPSYMSPEQASGHSGTVSQASDVYSLGAVLYELLTGRPPFRGHTILDTLSQVMHERPVRPRTIAPSILEDLQMICLKCLEKVPSDRYESAGDLSADLQRFLNDEPVTARPISRLALIGRKLRRHRIALTVVATILGAVWTAVAWWQDVEQRRHAAERALFTQVTFDTDGLPLKTEIFGSNSEQVVPEFTTPSLDPISLREGDYRIRFQAQNRPPQETRLLVHRDRPVGLDIELEDERVLESGDLEGLPVVVTLKDHADVLVVAAETVERRDGATGQVLWKTNLRRAAWESAEGQWSGQRNRKFHELPELVRPAPDIDHDGVGDLVWIGRLCVTAQSGANGQVLWCHTTEAVTPVREGLVGDIESPPVIVDMNGDGTVDLILSCLRRRKSGQTRYNGVPVFVEPERWIEAVSGVDGVHLWRSPVERSHWSDEQAQPVTLQLQASQETVVLTTDRSRLELDAATGDLLGSEPFVPQPSAATGKSSPAQPASFDPDYWGDRAEFVAARLQTEGAVLADLTGNGRLDLVWFDQRESRMQPAFGTLHTLAGRSPLEWRRLGEWQPASDYDGDGICDVRPVSWLWSSTNPMRRTASGRDGTIRSIPTELVPTMLELHLPHGDLDGDGIADLIQLDQNTVRGLPVFACSGRTGDAIWTGPLTLPCQSATAVSRIAVSATAVDLQNDGNPEVVLMAPREQGTCAIVICDGQSGQPVWETTINHTGDFSRGIWMELPAGDVSNGPAPLVIGHYERGELEYLAFGSDGKRLWRVSSVVASLWEQPAQRPRLARGDLDGDGMTEIVLIDHMKRQILAYEAGQDKPKWSAEIPKSARQTGTTYATRQGSFRVREVSPPVLIDLHGDGQHSVCFQSSGQINVLDHSGRLSREIELPQHRFVCGYGAFRLASRLLAVDLDADGREELLVTMAAPAGSEPKPQPDHLIAVDPRATGDPVLWHWTFPDGIGDLIGLHQGANGNFVEVTGSQGLYGLDPQNGRPLWNCLGPRWWGLREDSRIEWRQYHSHRPVRLGELDESLTAPVLFRRVNDKFQCVETSCRMARPSDPLLETGLPP